MDKRLQLQLSKVDPIPPSLRIEPSTNSPVKAVSVPMKTLLHHMFLDTHAVMHPKPETLLDAVAPLIQDGVELRFTVGGLGAHKDARTGELNKWGRAFCRWFLHEHYKVPFFVPLSEVLDRELPGPYRELRIRRTSEGDTPDYFCAQSVDTYCFAEAKGTEYPVGFKQKKFETWRDQFTRVELMRSPSGTSEVAIATKGWIVAARLASDRYTKRVRSTLFVEDPATQGEEPRDGDSWRPGRLAIAYHYAAVFEALRAPYYAAALREGFRVAPEVSFPIGIWRCKIPPFVDHEFVGGYHGVHTTPPEWLLDLDPFMPNSLWRRMSRNIDLSRSGGHFVGLELTRFKELREAMAAGLERLDQIRSAELQTGLFAHMSVLGDASVWGPLEYFQLFDVRNL